MLRLPLEYRIITHMNDETRDNLWLFFGFLVSLFHTILCGLFFLLLLLLTRRGAVGCIKAILTIIARTTLLNPVIAADASGLSIIKWLLVFLFAAYIVLFTKVPNPSDRQLLQTFSLLLLVYVLYIMIIALLNSSFPIVSIFKAISYSFVFYAIMKGIAVSNAHYDWCKYLRVIFSAFFIVSLFTIPIMSMRPISVHYFQGIAIHPNAFAIYAAAYVALLLNNMEKHPKFNTMMIVVVMFMIYISRSRTAMFTCVIMLLLYFLGLLKHKHKTAICIVVTITFILLALSVFLPGQYISLIERFVFKGNVDSILFSREVQLELFNQRFEASPYFGTGFMVPFVPLIRDFGFAFDLYVEHGNILFAILGDTGIIGLLLFLLLYGYIFASGFRRNFILFLFPLIVSAGEMVFFSTNSMGVLFYVFFGVFLFSSTSTVSSAQYNGIIHKVSNRKMLSVRI